MTDNANAAAQHDAQPVAGAAPPPPPPAQPAAPPQHYMQSDPRQKSPFLAGLLSFMPGLGQIGLPRGSCGSCSRARRSPACAT
jgi:hypothetical protein